MFRKLFVGIVGLAILAPPADAAQTFHMKLAIGGSDIVGETTHVLKCPANPIGKHRSWIEKNCETQKITTKSDYPAVRYSRDGILVESR